MADSPRRSRGRVALLVLVALSAVYLATCSTGLLTNDVVTSSVSAWHLAASGSPWLDHLDVEAITGRDDLWIDRGANGHVAGLRSPGSIAAAVPAYWIAAHVGVHAFSILPASATAAVLTSMAMVLLFLTLEGRCTRTLALGATATVALTTPVWTVSADSMWTHPVTLLGVAGMGWAAARERWWLVGLFGGVAVWGRLHTAVIVAVVGLGVAWTRRSPRVALSTGTVSALLLGLAALWSHWVYGTWNPAGGYSISTYTDRAVGGSDTWEDQLVNHLGLWVSPGRGVLVWTPIVLLLAPALWRSWRQLPDWSRWLLVGGIVYAVVQGQLNGFSGGSYFYPYRLMLEPLVCAAPALAMSAPRCGTWARRLAGPLVGLQFAVISVGAMADGGIASEAHLWTDNAFWFATRHLPALGLWALAMTGVGWWVGRALQHRAGQSALEPSAAA